MVHYRRSRIPNAAYFLTVTLRDRQSDLLVRYIDPLRAVFRATREAHPFTTEAIVVLPEHFHWLCRLPEGDADFSVRIQQIKRHFTLALLEAGLPLIRDSRGEYRLWQRRFWEHTIRDERDFERHVDYIHYNPVKHDLVRAVADWPHSSFHRYVRDGLLSADWGGTSPAEPASGTGEPRL
ncbi:MAG TPA: transposase [Ramlibacter sp.]|nr:transposase [Ramlibacter sp.]